MFEFIESQQQAIKHKSILFNKTIQGRTLGKDGNPSDDANTSAKIVF